MGRIRIGTTDETFSAKAKIRLSLWDTKSGRASGKSAEATQLNRKLDTMNGVINSRYRELLKTKENVTAKKLKVAFQGIASHHPTLINYFENYLKEYEKRVEKDRSENAFINLKYALIHLRDFLQTKYKMKDIPFTSLNESFIDDYDYYLRIALGFAPRTIAARISTMRRMIKYAINESIILLDIRGYYSVKELVDMYISNSFNGYLFTFIDLIIKNLKDDNRQKTASLYNTVKLSFYRFLSSQDILIDNIDNHLILKYETYLKNIGVRKNSISCYIRVLRSIYNQAVEKGLATQKNPFKGAYMGVDKTVKRAVSEDVVIQLKNMDLSGYKTLALAQDIFMFSFYMRGMSYVDMANLRKSNIKNGYIIYARSKTKQILTIKIEPCMQEIIARYQMQTIDDFLLPIYTLQNSDHISQLRTYNKRLKKISDMMELEKPLSSYVTRHSWATIARRCCHKPVLLCVAQ